MLIFLQEWLFVLAMLVALGLAGGFALVPFRGASPFIFLAAPLAGFLLLGLGIAALYCGLALTVPVAGVAVLSVGGLATLASLAALRQNLRIDAFALALALILSALITLTLTMATISDGSPSLNYMDGADQGWYAATADWLRTHYISRPPALSPDLPYQSTPQGMFAGDPRFGGMYVLAFISWVRGVPALFAFDSTCAVVLSCGIMAIAGAFSRSRRSLVLLLVGLATSYWFDLSRTGYYGKLVGYPADLFVLRLFFHEARHRSVIGIVFLALFAAAAAIVHSVMSTAAVLMPAGLAYLAARLCLDRRGKASWQELGDGAAIFTLMCFVALSQLGMFGRPGVLPGVAMGGVPFDWANILEAALDLEDFAPHFFSLSPEWLYAAVGFSLFLWAAFLVLAAVTRNFVAFGLLAGPAALFTVLYAKGNSWVAYESVGTYAAPALCAAALLIDETRQKWRFVSGAAVAAIGLLILTHQPRFAGILGRYVFGDTPTQIRFRYSECEIDALAAAIGHSSVRVDLPEPHDIFLILDEFGRRGINLQMSERSWTLLAYRHWAPPTFAEPAEFRLTEATEVADPDDIVLRTPQFLLIRRHGQTQNATKAPAAADAVAAGECRLVQAGNDHAPAPWQPAPPLPPPPAAAPVLKLPPSGVRSFPAGLFAPNLYFAGVAQDGWLTGKTAEVRLALPEGGDLLHITGDIPDFSAKINGGVLKIAVDGTPVLERPETAGSLDLIIPIPKGDGIRRIKLGMTGTDNLPPPDGRLVSIHLTSIALERSDLSGSQRAQ